MALPEHLFSHVNTPQHISSLKQDLTSKLGPPVAESDAGRVQTPSSMYAVEADLEHGTKLRNSSPSSKRKKKKKKKK